jgi:anti-anti-sigma regulatory factor
MGVIKIDSAVTFETVMVWQKKIERAIFMARDHLVIEFEPDVLLDSAVLPLLLASIRYGAHKKCKCLFKALPESLMRIARVYGLAAVLIEKVKV